MDNQVSSTSFSPPAIRLELLQVVILLTLSAGVGSSLDSLHIVMSLHYSRAFLLQVPVTIAAILSVSLALHLPKTETSDFMANFKRVDWAGAISLILTVFFLLFALDRGGNISWSDHLTIFSLAAFSICFISFALIEMKFASEPFAPKRIIVNRTLIASYLVNFFGMASGFISLFYLPLYLQAVLGKTASQAGLWLLIGVFSSLLGSLCSGLIMQATGKYYRLTVISYIALFLGIIIVNLSTGIIASSFIGVAAGKYLLSSACWQYNEPIVSIGIMISNMGNGERTLHFRFLTGSSLYFSEWDHKQPYISHRKRRSRGPSHCNRWQSHFSSHIILIFELTETTQYPTFSALSVLLLDYRSEAHLYKAPCGLRFTESSLVLMLMRYV